MYGYSAGENARNGGKVRYRAGRLCWAGLRSTAYPGPSSRWIASSVWFAGALLTWLICFVGAELTAGAIAEVPQPNQQLWIALVQYSPAYPVVFAVSVGVAYGIARRSLPAAVLAAAQGLMWPSAGLIFLWIPKAP